tara:strand:- start:227 stop:457 length:231 start_codon:yes stop_codon:yes gene_type:complete
MLRVFIICAALAFPPSSVASANDSSCYGDCMINLIPVIHAATEFVKHLDEMTGEVVSDSIETVGDKINEVFGDKSE